MKTSQLFTISTSVIERMKRTIKKGSRSRFVESAIKARLDGKEQLNVRDIPTHILCIELFNRDISPAINALLALEFDKK